MAGGWRVDEDGGSMTLCDVGRLTRSDFLTGCGMADLSMVLRRWRVYDPDVGRLARSDFLTGWDADM